MKGRRKSLFLVLAIASVVCFGAVGGVYADPFPIEPYISMTIPAKLDLGTIDRPATAVFTPTFPVHIAANVPHHLEMSLSVLLQTEGNGAITPTNFRVLTPIASAMATPPGGVDINVQVQLELPNAKVTRAGTYTGTLTITAIPGP